MFFKFEAFFSKGVYDFYAFLYNLDNSLASFQGSSPAFCRILYSMRQKAGEDPGNEATIPHIKICLMFHFYLMRSHLEEALMTRMLVKAIDGKSFQLTSLSYSTSADCLNMLTIGSRI